MRIVVTGALGHIGSRLIRELPRLIDDAEIVMIDNLSTQRFASLFGLPQGPRYRFVEADVTRHELAPLVDGADAVVHLAALTDAEASVALREKVERNNFSATERVASAAAGAGAMLLFPSTTSVYGSQDALVDEQCPDEDLRPQSPYAETKLREEALLRSLASKGQLKMAICRLGTIVGPSPGMRFHTAVNKFCWQAVMGQPLTVWRTALHQVRPYLDLDDAVRSVGFFLRRRLADGRVYNVVTANRTATQITDSIRSLVPDLAVELVDSPIMNQLSYEISNARMLAEGFVFQGSIERGIAATVELLRSAASWRPRK